VRYNFDCTSTGKTAKVLVPSHSDTSIQARPGEPCNSGGCFYQDTFPVKNMATISEAFTAIPVGLGISYVDIIQSAAVDTQTMSSATDSLQPGTTLHSALDLDSTANENNAPQISTNATAVESLACDSSRASSDQTSVVQTAYEEISDNELYRKQAHNSATDDPSTADGNGLRSSCNSAAHTSLTPPPTSPLSPTLADDPQSSSRSPPSPPISRKRKKSASDDDSLDATIPEPPSKKLKKSVHWPIDRNAKTRKEKHRSAITQVWEIPNSIQDVDACPVAMLKAFNKSTEQVKNALSYLAPSSMQYVAQFLPIIYQQPFLLVAKHFRDESRGDGVDLPGVDERKALKKELLQFLSTMNTSFIFCHDCEAVHLAGPYLSGCASKWPIGSINGMFTTSFADIQKGMNVIRAGRMQTPRMFRSMSSKTVVHICENICELEMWEPFVADCRLLLKSQKWFIVNFKCSDYNTAMEKYLRSNPLRKERILCRHLKKLYEYDELYDCKSKEITLSTPVRCEECALEFQVDAANFGRIGWALVISSWRDLGKCTSVYDRRFQAHFKEYEKLSFTMSHGRTRRRKNIATTPTPKFDEDEIYDLGDNWWLDGTEEDNDAIDNDSEAGEQDNQLPRGWDEDEEGETSDWCIGGIRDAFEIRGFNLDDCLDEDELRSILNKKMSNLRKYHGDDVGGDFMLMPRLRRWGGDVDDLMDLYTRADAR
jgi:hypothetical protein